MGIVNICLYITLFVRMLLYIQNIPRGKTARVAGEHAIGSGGLQWD